MHTQQQQNEAGFSYIDVLVAITIMAVGILGLTGAILFSLVRSQESERRLFAKQLAQSTVESIFSARDIEGVFDDGWESVGNIGSNPDAQGNGRGIFVIGWHPIREEAGSDGVVGTPDDSCAGTGGCQTPGNPINNSPLVPGFRRRIVIEDLPDPERPGTTMRRTVVVTVEYQVGNLIREEKMTTVIADLNSIGRVESNENQ